MRIVDVKPAGYRALIEHDVEDLAKLLRALDCMSCDLNGRTKEDREAVSYLTQVFYPRVEKLLKELGYGS